MNPFLVSLTPAWVSPKHVRIHEGALEAFAGGISTYDFPTPSWREEVFPEGDDATFVQFIGIANAINFCFIDFSTGQKFDAEYPRGSGTMWRGSYAMAACLKRALDEGVPILDPQFLACLEAKDAERIFESVTTPIPLLDRRLAHLQDVGEQLSHGRGDFLQFFNKSEFHLFYNGWGIAEYLHKNFKSYGDWHSWRGKQLIFAKRALLFPMMYHGRALASQGKLPLIQDPEHFSPILDYVIPNALRIVGILQYTPALQEKILSGALIPHGSDEEVEIRAVAARATALLLQEINYRRTPQNKIQMPALDSYLWRHGRQTVDSKHHKTLTTAY